MLKNRFLLLFLSLVLFLILPPFIGNPVTKHLIVSILFTITLGNSIFITYNTRKKSHWSIILPLIIILFTWSEYLVPFKESLMVTVTYLTLLSFFIYIIVLLFRYLFKQNEIDHNIFFVSLSIYLLMGIIGGLLFTAMNNLLVGAFQNNQDGMLNITDFMYFSFVTMTTIGYGDISPAIPKTMMASILLAVLGQVYLTVIVAIMVGKYISQSRK